MHDRENIGEKAILFRRALARELFALAAARIRINENTALSRRHAQILRRYKIAYC